jgi:heme exporter protein A
VRARFSADFSRPGPPAVSPAADPTAAQPLAVHGLVCRRGPRRVLDGVGFTVAAGGVLLLRGPNGSGKSTLLRCLAGLLRPEAGEILRDGAPIAADPEGHRRWLRYLGHQDGVKPQLSVAENLGFAAALAGRAGADLPTALAAFGIAHLGGLPARILSAGQRRRLALARLVAAPAPLWLLDEPLAGLDDAAQSLFTAALAAHRAAGGLAVLSVHGPFDVPGARVLDLAGQAASASAA